MPVRISLSAYWTMQGAKKGTMAIHEVRAVKRTLKEGELNFSINVSWILSASVYNFDLLLTHLF